MFETIAGFIITSGFLGIVANWTVSGVKRLRTRVLDGGQINPRALAAAMSLVLALSTVMAGGDADRHAIQSALEVLLLAGTTWLTAHATHRANSI